MINLDLFLEIEVRDANGKLLSKKKVESNSLVTGFMGILRAFFNGSSTVKDTGGANRTAIGSLTYGVSPYRYFLAMCVNAEVSNSLYGIQVGSDNTAVTNSDFKLGTPIVHGSTIGTLLYNATTVESVAGAPPVSSVRVIRTFSNSSGSTVTVKEIGMVAYNGTTASQYAFLIVRDVPTPIVVPNGSTLTVRYLFYVTA